MNVIRKINSVAPVTFSIFVVSAAVLFALHTGYGLWSGYILSFYWVLVQICSTEIVYRNFFRNGKIIPGADRIDLALAVFGAIFLTLLSASLFMDLIPENVSSNVYIVNDFFPPNQCDQIVTIAEEYAQTNGWLTKRHKNYPTTDLAVYSLRSNITINDHKSVDFGAWINSTIESRIFPLIASKYGLSDPSLLSMQDLFVVKYDADTPHAQRHLQKHTDSSLISFNIALSVRTTAVAATSAEGSSSSDSGDIVDTTFTQAVAVAAAAAAAGSTRYVGGGTHFVVSDEVVAIDKGSLLIHPSRVFHSGQPITAGKRYILVGFVRVREWTWGTVWRRFGGFTKCLTVRTVDGTDGTEVVTSPRKCRAFLWVYVHEVYVVFTDIMTKPVQRGQDLALKGIVVLVSVSVVGVVVALIGLCWASYVDSAAEKEHRRQAALQSREQHRSVNDRGGRYANEEEEDGSSSSCAEESVATLQQLAAGVGGMAPKEVRTKQT